MNTVRILFLVGFASIAATSALATPSEVTLYDAPQQQDSFFLMQRGGPADVLATRSFNVAPSSAAVSSIRPAPFWDAQERISRESDNR